VITDYEDADGTYRHSEKEVTIQLRDRSVRDMKTVLEAVLEMWITEFKSRGLLGRLEPRRTEAHSIPTRATASGAATMSLTALQGVRFNRSFRRQKFNHATGKVEPIDMTGHTYQFSIYKPIEAEIEMTNNQTGQKIKGTVELSAEETMQYRRLTTDEERRAFEESLAPKYAVELLRRSIVPGDQRQ
jgi:hypothetical protein